MVDKQGSFIHFRQPAKPSTVIWIHYPVEVHRSALFIDHSSLSSIQEKLIGALKNSEVHITDPAGTDLTFRLNQAHFHLGNGDASKEFIAAHARHGSARDREVELPAGAIRTVDIEDAEGILVCADETFGGRQVGNLKFWFKDNRIVRLESQHQNDFVQAMWALAAGDKDRIGDFNLGVNSALKMLPDLDDVIPYFGYGEGIVRISLGDNKESGGVYSSSYHQWLFLTKATVQADGIPIVENGDLAAK